MTSTTANTTLTFYIFAEENGVPACIGGGVRRGGSAALHIVLNGVEYVALPMNATVPHGGAELVC